MHLLPADAECWGSYQRVSLMEIDTGRSAAAAESLTRDTSA